MSRVWCVLFVVWPFGQFLECFDFRPGVLLYRVDGSIAL